VRTSKEIRALVASDPFAGVSIDKNTRLYISFLAKVGSGDSLSEKLLSHDEGSSRILAIHRGHIVAVAQLGARKGTVNLMELLDQHFGDKITTRNWNTVLKIDAMMGED
jgi:uncharacterized protein (DUF1697 family)